MRRMRLIRGQAGAIVERLDHDVGVPLGPGRADVLPHLDRPECGHGRGQATEVPEERLALRRRDRILEGPEDDVAKRHAELYGKLFAMFLRRQKDIGRITFWGVHDGRSWLNNFPVRGRTDYPLLFDRQGKPKAAFIAVTNAAKDADGAPEKTPKGDGKQ